MALKGKIYSLAKQREDIDSRNVFESMIKRSADQDSIFMDGRNLAAGSIFAEQIHTGAIEADHIKSGAIKTDHMLAGTIDVSVLKSSQLILPGENYGGVVIDSEGISMKSTGTAKLDVKLSSASGFNITDRFNNQLIDINSSTGNVKMQVNEMTIGGYSAATTKDIDDIEVGGRNYFVIKDLTPKPYPLVGNDHEYTYNLKPNTTYTISTTGTKGASFRVNGETASFSVTGNKGYRVTTDSSGILRIGLYASSGETDQFIDGSARLKLEEGTIKTDWTPAPEDVQAEIDSRPTFQDFDKTDKVTINGGNIKAGTISSKNNYSRINLDDGSFSFGDGRLVWNGSEMTVNGKISVNNIDGDIPKSKLADSVQTEINAGTTAKNTLDSKGSTWDNVVNKQDADSRLDNIVSVHNLPYTKDIIVYGDSDKYYPVYVRGGNQDLFRTIKIWRSFYERGPNDWYSTTHRGSLMLTWKGNFGGWGGAVYREFIEENTSQYTTLLADCFRSVHSMAYTFMLRGGGSGGAIYHMASDQNLNQVEIYYNGSSDIVYPSSNASYVVRAANPVTTVNTKKLEELKMAKSKEVIEVDEKASDAKAKTDEWSWEDTAEIDGGSIRAQTITTDQIKANSITSTEINVGELSSITTNIGTVNAGIIKSFDESIIINLNEGLITLGKPLKIQGKTVATEDDISSLGYGDIISKSSQEIFTDQAEDSAVHVEVDGESVGGGSNNLFSKGDFYNWSSVTTRWKDDRLYISSPSSGGIWFKSELFELGVKYSLGFKARLISGEVIGLAGHSSRHTVIGYQDGVSLGTWSSSVSSPQNPLEVGKVYNYRLEITKDSEGDYVYIQPNRFSYGREYEIELFDIQLNKGDMPFEYEGLKPTPDYPIEIHSLNGFDVVSSASGRNLIIRNTETLNTWIYMSGNIVHAGNHDTSDYIKVEPNTDYMFTKSNSELANDAGFFRWSWYDADMVYIDRRANSNNEVLWKIPDTVHYIRVSYPTDSIPKLEKGSTATPWTPAPEDITEGDNHPLIDKINLSLSEPLRSVGDVKDRLFKDSDGLWKIERNVGERVLNGGENWYAQEEGSYYTFCPGKKIGANTNLQSNRFNFASSANEARQLGIGVMRNSATNNTAIVFYFDEGVGGTGSFKSWLSSNSTEVYYELAIPTIEILDQDLQDKLNTLKSFKGSNYIYTVNNTEDLPDQIKENLIPTLHATFKGGGWLPKYNAEQARIDLKSETNSIRNDMGNLVTSDRYNFDKGETDQILNDYQAAIDVARRELNGLVNEDGELILGEDGEPLQKGVVNEVMDLLNRTALVERDYGEHSEKLKFMDTEFVRGAEGMFIGDTETRTGIMISPRVEETTEHEARASRIDFLDNDKVVAYISSYMMEISRGIFVESAQIGEHKIETIGDGHTTFQWIPK